MPPLLGVERDKRAHVQVESRCVAAVADPREASAHDSEASARSRSNAWRELRAFTPGKSLSNPGQLAGYPGVRRAITGRQGDRAALLAGRRGGACRPLAP